MCIHQIEIKGTVYGVDRGKDVDSGLVEECLVYSLIECSDCRLL